MSDQPSDYGRYLQTHRRAKGMSLEVVAQKTKISMTCLRQIENESGTDLPAPTFVKGFIRAYAELVGADVQDALGRYHAHNEAYQGVDQEDAVGGDRNLRFWGRMLLVFLLLGVLIGGTIYIIQQMDRPAQNMPPDQGDPIETPLPTVPPNSPSEAPNDPLIDDPVDIPLPNFNQPEPARSVDQEPAPSNNPPSETAYRAQEMPEIEAVVEPEAIESVEADDVALPAVQKETMVLKVTAMELTWLRITADQASPREMTLNPGATAALEAEEGFQLLIGNAGGVRLSLNDQPVRVPGRSGQVVTLRLP